MRVVAILAVYNEERFIGPCLENLFRQGVEVYLIDNDSTDRTAEIARGYLGRGLVGIEKLPRAGVYEWTAILRRKEQLAATLEADWFMHTDADEFYPSPRPGVTLAEALAEADAQGFNAVNFTEFVFIPTRENPDHDHADFLSTMRWYYPHTPSSRYLIRAWKRQPAPVDLTWSGGHMVRFPDLRLSPAYFPQRHYYVLSVQHAIRKYVFRHYDPREVQNGWHGWRARLRPDMIEFPPESELRAYAADDQLDPSDPRTRHYFCAQAELETPQQLLARLHNVEEELRATRLQLERVTNSSGWRVLTRCVRLTDACLSAAHKLLRARRVEPERQTAHVN